MYVKYAKVHKLNSFYKQTDDVAYVHCIVVQYSDLYVNAIFFNVLIELLTQTMYIFLFYEKYHFLAVNISSFSVEKKHVHCLR